MKTRNELIILINSEKKKDEVINRRAGEIK